jgi:hypothetical protein
MSTLLPHNKWGPNIEDWEWELEANIPIRNPMVETPVTDIEERRITQSIYMQRKPRVSCEDFAKSYSERSFEAVLPNHQAQMVTQRLEEEMESPIERSLPIPTALVHR